MREAVTFSVVIDRSDYDALYRIAEDRSATLGAVVREALGAYVRRKRR